MSPEDISQHLTAHGVLCRFAVTALTLVVVAILSYLFWWRAWESDRANRNPRTIAGACKLPSPVAVLPRWVGLIGGHTMQINSEKLVQQLEGWADELGGNFELTLFGRRAVVATTVADVRRVLSLRPQVFRRGLTPTHFNWPAEKIGLLPAMFFDEGKQWGRSRRLICPHLVGHNVTNMIPSIAKMVERFCAQLDEKADAGEVVDAIYAFERFAHDSIALAAFGLHTDSIGTPPDQTCPSFDCVRTVMMSFMTLMLQPLAMLGWVMLPWLLPWVRHTHAQANQLEDMVQGAINKARIENRKGVENGSGEGAVDSISSGVLLRKMVAEAEGKKNVKHLPERMGFSDQEMIRQVMSLFIGGTGTTSFVLCWAMIYLTKNPQMQTRCREEALRVAPDSNGLVSTREQLSELVFCSAIFTETLRVNSSSTVLFFHNAEATKMVNGTSLEKDTGVIVLTRYAGLSNEFFTRAKEFIPERWIEDERKEALLREGEHAEGNRTVNHDERAFLSLGSGPRSCPGKVVAKVEATMIIAAICARFDVALEPSQGDPDEILTYASGPRTTRLVFTRRAT